MYEIQLNNFEKLKSEMQFKLQQVERISNKFSQMNKKITWKGYQKINSVLMRQVQIKHTSQFLVQLNKQYFAQMKTQGVIDKLQRKKKIYEQNLKNLNNKIQFLTKKIKKSEKQKSLNNQPDSYLKNNIQIIGKNDQGEQIFNIIQVDNQQDLDVSEWSKEKVKKQKNQNQISEQTNQTHKQVNQTKALIKQTKQQNNHKQQENAQKQIHVTLQAYSSVLNKQPSTQTDMLPIIKKVIQKGENNCSIEQETIEEENEDMDLFCDQNQYSEDDDQEQQQNEVDQKTINDENCPQMIYSKITPPSTKDVSNAKIQNLNLEIIPQANIIHSKTKVNVQSQSKIVKPQQKQPTTTTTIQTSESNISKPQQKKQPTKTQPVKTISKFKLQRMKNRQQQ